MKRISLRPQRSHFFFAASIANQGWFAIESPRGEPVKRRRPSPLTFTSPFEILPHFGKRLTLESSMTPEQVTLVQESWKKVAPISDTAADLFYGRLFEIAPDVKPLFPEEMSGQKKKLMQTLGYVVGGLNNLEGIVGAVKELGVKHVDYKVTPEMYSSVGAALLWTLEQGLGEDFTPDVGEAWGTAYGILSTTMIEAAEQAA